MLPSEIHNMWLRHCIGTQETQVSALHVLCDLAQVISCLCASISHLYCGVYNTTIPYRGILKINAPYSELLKNYINKFQKNAVHNNRI